MHLYICLFYEEYLLIKFSYCFKNCLIQGFNRVLGNMGFILLSFSLLRNYLIKKRRVEMTLRLKNSYKCNNQLIHLKMVKVDLIYLKSLLKRIQKTRKLTLVSSNFKRDLVIGLYIILVFIQLLWLWTLTKSIIIILFYERMECVIHYFMFHFIFLLLVKVTWIIYFQKLVPSINSSGIILFKRKKIIINILFLLKSKV